MSRTSLVNSMGVPETSLGHESNNITIHLLESNEECLREGNRIQRRKKGYLFQVELFVLKIHFLVLDRPVHWSKSMIVDLISLPLQHHCHFLHPPSVKFELQKHPSTSFCRVLFLLSSFGPIKTPQDLSSTFCYVQYVVGNLLFRGGLD